MYSSLCLLKILFSLVCWIEQRMDGVRCVVFCTTSHLSSSCGATMFLWVLHLGWWALVFVPRAFAYFTVNLIVVSIYLCSILPYNLITNRNKKFVVELNKVYLSLIIIIVTVTVTYFLLVQ
jgi:hypothetical protein